jgi:hypothetical protein
VTQSCRFACIMARQVLAAGVDCTRSKLKIEKSVFLDRSASGHRTFSIPHITSGHSHIARDHAPSTDPAGHLRCGYEPSPARQLQTPYRRPAAPPSFGCRCSHERARRPLNLVPRTSTPTCILSACHCQCRMDFHADRAQSAPIRSSVHRPHVHVKPAALLASTASSPWVLYSNPRVSTNS